MNEVPASASITASGATAATASAKACAPTAGSGVSERLQGVPPEHRMPSALVSDAARCCFTAVLDTILRAGVGQERRGPSYFFISFVLGPLNSLLWYVPSSRCIWSSAPVLFLQEQIKDIIIMRNGCGQRLFPATSQTSQTCLTCCSGPSWPRSHIAKT